jgi:Zn-dependent protease with chaperone function
MTQRGLWYDGQVALERPVTVSQGPSGLIFIDKADERLIVASSDLVRFGGTPNRPRFGHRSIEGWRLVLLEPVDPALLAGLPTRGGSLVPPTGGKAVALLGAGLAAITLLVGLVIFAPQTIAEHMPMSWERKLGAAFDFPIEASKCDNPAAQRALNHIVDRLDPTARKDGFTVELVDLSEANAAALPGGRMIVLNGLFDDIDDPDAIAGIVAHEIAHVRRRHVPAAMVRQLGLGTVATLMGGGAVASNASGLLSLKYSRTAEAEADSDAIAMLARAGIDPRPTARAFDEFRKAEGSLPEWLGSHPASAGRSKAFASSYRADRSYHPVLDARETKSLMSACRS